MEKYCVQQIVPVMIRLSCIFNIFLSSESWDLVDRRGCHITTITARNLTSHPRLALKTLLLMGMTTLILFLTSNWILKKQFCYDFVIRELNIGLLLLFRLEVIRLNLN